VFGTLFSGNENVNKGHDISSLSGTITIHSICPAGYKGRSATQGDALDTFKITVTNATGVSGPPFSFTDFPCTVCPAGGYSASLGSEECVVCPAGKVLEDASINHLLHDSVEACKFSCSAGTSTPVEETFAARDSIDDCAICPAGAYAPAGEGCTSCPAGSYLQDAGTSASLHDSFGDCTTCPSGKYLEDGTEFGDASLHASADQCLSCDAGMYLSDSQDVLKHDSSNDCKQCAAGKSSLKGEGACTDCTMGKYAQAPGSASCIDCAVGMYANATGQDACVQCPLNKYVRAKQRRAKHAHAKS
jgi:hypothetical protein